MPNYWWWRTYFSLLLLLDSFLTAQEVKSQLQERSRTSHARRVLQAGPPFFQMLNSTEPGASQQARVGYFYHGLC